MVIKLATGKVKSFKSLEEALEYCEECTCSIYTIYLEDNNIVASGNGVEFIVATVCEV